MLQMHSNNCPAHALVASTRAVHLRDRLVACVLHLSEVGGPSRARRRPVPAHRLKNESSGINPSGSQKAQFWRDGRGSECRNNTRKYNALPPSSNNEFQAGASSSSRNNVVGFVGVKSSACFPERKELKRVSQTRKQVQSTTQERSQKERSFVRRYQLNRAAWCVYHQLSDAPRKRAAGAGGGRMTRRQPGWACSDFRSRFASPYITWIDAGAAQCTMGARGQERD